MFQSVFLLPGTSHFFFRIPFLLAFLSLLHGILMTRNATSHGPAKQLQLQLQFLPHGNGWHFPLLNALIGFEKLPQMFFFLPMDFLFFFEDFVGQKGQILPKARPANKVIKASKNLEMVGQCVLRLFVSSGAKCMHQNFPKL